jgi:pimeloyl-ACP methyl ester carboxylesterase
MEDQQLMLKLNQLDEEELVHYVRDEMSASDMARYFGEHANLIHTYAEVDVPADKQGDSLIVLLPGMMGSVLENVGEKDPGVIWINFAALIKGHMAYMQLAPDGKSDLAPGVSIRAPRPLWLAYSKLFMRLRHEFDICCFPYDWRRSSRDNALLLRDFIDYRLASSPHDRATLVGHSMGGLVSMHYLHGEATQAHAEQSVQRLIALGSPFRGAVEAVPILSQANSAKMKLAALLNKDNNPLKVVLSMPSIYELLPAPNTLYPNWDPVPELDIWDAATWKALGILFSEQHLDHAKESHRLIAEADPQVPVYTVIGTNYNTPVRLLGKMLTGELLTRQDGEAGGDGTVEVLSARFKDRPAYYLHEVHIELVLDNTVIESIMEWVNGGEPTRLVTDIADVVLDDSRFRGVGEVLPYGVDAEQMAQKITTNDKLDHDEVKVMMQAF